ncbi:MAG TPA: hypothetical protein VGM80_07630 [Gaiellaceae bacterium]|jgi:hypothetical protein
MLVGLDGRGYAFLVVAIGPVVVAAIVVWLVWRWAKRSEEAERNQQ